MDKLKPCPFCGSEAAEPVFIGNDHTKKRTVTIKCKAPGCTKGVTVGALRFSHEWCHAEAVKKWNTRTTDTALAAAEARIAELLAREQREAEQRKKQGLVLDYAMRGLRHSAEHPDDGRMQAVRALAQHSEKQAGRIAALEKALWDIRITIEGDLDVTIRDLVNGTANADDLYADRDKIVAYCDAALLKEKE